MTPDATLFEATLGQGGRKDQVVAPLSVSDDERGEPAIRLGVAANRVVSHSAPGMRHGRKSASRRFDDTELDVIADEDSELVVGRGGARRQRR